MTRRTGSVLCVGEAMVALTPTAGPLRTATDLAVSAAGAELNVAIHLSRLGIAARFAGRVGDDPFGHLLRDALIAEGVDVTGLELDPTLPTGLYAKDPGGGDTVVHYYRAGSAATRMGELADGALDGVGLVHLTGITPALSPACAGLVSRLLRDPSCTVSFDVNHRPALWSAADAAAPLLELARRADVALVGLDEAARLWGTANPDDVRALLPDVGELVIKDGGRAATAYVGDRGFVVAALPVDVVEPIGAGDAFAAGYLAGRLSGATPTLALRQGHVVAAATLTEHSDNGRTPDRHLLAAAQTGEHWPPG